MEASKLPVRAVGSSVRALDRLTSMRPGIVLAVVMVAAGCVIDEVRMETRALPERNPTAYPFEFPLGEIRARVLAGLARSEQHENPIFGGNEGWGDLAVFQVTEAGVVPSWLKVLELPGNQRDLYLHASHEPLWRSPVYRGPQDGLPFFAGFHVHFAALGPARTSVSVTALATEVLNGSTWGIGLGGPGTANRTVRVEPTSIEEYVILRYLGDLLGVRTIPDVILPAPGPASAGDEQRDERSRDGFEPAACG